MDLSMGLDARDSKIMGELPLGVKGSNSGDVRLNEGTTNDLILSVGG
jgi:hypothetical protein